MSESGSPAGEPDSSNSSKSKELLKDPDWMYKKYVEEGLSYREIGEIAGVCQSTAWKHAQKHNIESRSFGEHQTIPELADKDSFFELYIEEDLSQSEIAERVGCGHTAVQNWRRKHGIPAKNPKTKVDERLSDKSWLREMYDKRGLTLREIADQIDEKYTNVWRAVRQSDIELNADGFQPGQEHFNWKGGHEKYYGANWEEQRDKALERDDHTCQRCKTQESFDGRNLSVHHRKRLGWFKEEYDAPEWWERGNDLDNLITLCEPCHGKWEFIPLQFDVR